MRKIAWLLLVALAACGESGDSEDGLQVTRAQMGEDWPLTVEEGTLRCDADAVTIEADGVTYWVNGTASARADAEGWADVEAIWAPDPDIPGMNINIGAILDPGLDLCDQQGT